MFGSSIYDNYGEGVEETKGSNYKDSGDNNMEESAQMDILKALAEKNHDYYNFNKDGFIDYHDIDERHYTHYNSDDDIDERHHTHYNSDDDIDERHHTHYNSDDNDDDGVEESKCDKDSNYSDDDNMEESAQMDILKALVKKNHDYYNFNEDDGVEKSKCDKDSNYSDEYLLGYNIARSIYMSKYSDASMLVDLPETISSIGYLRHITRPITFTSLPESIPSLSDLNFLNLCPNKLTSLPESIPSLDNLRRLYLSPDTNYDKAQLTYQMFGNENNLSNSKTHLNKTSVPKPKYKKTCFSTYSSVQSFKNNHR